MKHLPTLIGLSLIGLSALALAGCGGAAADAPETHPVTGLVTYKNAPVAGATVTFAPDGGQQRSAFGITGDDGRYTLTTVQPEDGAMPGTYKVSVAKTEKPAAAPAGQGVTEDDPNYVPAPDNPKPTPPPKSLIPQKYSNSASSGLTAQVKEGENNFDFALAD